MTAVNLKVLLLSAMGQPYRPNKVHDSSYGARTIGACLVSASESCRDIERGYELGQAGRGIAAKGVCPATG